MRAALAATIAAVALVVITPPAHAEDQRPCVSSREFHSVKRWTKSEIETRWEVVGLGKHRVLIGIGPAMVYPRCAYKPSEALYAIAYLNGRAHMAVEFKEVGAQPHGRPRTQP